MSALERTARALGSEIIEILVRRPMLHCSTTCRYDPPRKAAPLAQAMRLPLNALSEATLRNDARSRFTATHIRNCMRTLGMTL